MTQRKLNRLEVTLLVVPALLLLGCGLWLSSRSKAEPRRQVPFQLTIAKAEFRVLPKSRTSQKRPFPAMKVARVFIYIGHQGPQPLWWGTDANAANEQIEFIGKGETSLSQHNKDGGHGAIYHSLNFDESRRQYFQTCEVEVPARPGFLEQSTCLVQVTLETQVQPPKKLATLQARIPVRHIKY